MNKDQTIRLINLFKQEKEILTFARLGGKKFDYLIQTQFRYTISWYSYPLRRDIA
ncbi:hypothetical protein J6TS2_31740 [Heyndrickxia sporothermodurans]|nr:hypothetical protein J6TS2_31740 [Heyndrickxia sporothermodurans]